MVLCGHYSSEILSIDNELTDKSFCWIQQISKKLVKCVWTRNCLQKQNIPNVAHFSVENTEKFCIDFPTEKYRP